MLCLDSARLYGLVTGGPVVVTGGPVVVTGGPVVVTGGPVVNVARCSPRYGGFATRGQAVLEEGAAMSIRPAPDAVERWMKALLGAEDV